jgi:glycosyltransferase involved in cell wall biosynthesis/ribosomal protein S18 acetylase RimI-like enzyme
MSVIRVAHVATVDMTHRFLLLPQMRRLQKEGYEVAAISAPGPWREGIEVEGIRFIRWPYVTRDWSPAADAMAFRSLVRMLRRERFDLVHTHTPKAGAMGRIAARMAGVPCVVNTVHGLYATPEDPVRRRLPVLAVERIAARFSDLELFQSEEDLLWARRIGLVPRGQGVLLGNGTDLEHFDRSSVGPTRRAEIRRELGIPEEALVVGTVGRPVAEKGYGEFARAAKMVTDAIPNTRFLAVGGGVSRAPGTDGAPVIFAGWRENVRDLLSAMDVFVLASWREGVPRSAIEAAAMGLPLVLTDIRGCREVCRDGVEGTLVPPRNAEQLAQAIADLVRDPVARERMGDAARRRAEERFDERRVTQTILTSYEDLLRRKGLSRVAKAPSAVRLRPARVEDAPALAQIHREALPDAFLPALGDRFLRRLYRALAADRRAVALVAENGSGVIGFATGVPSVRTFYRRFVLRHGVPAALSAAPRLLRRDVRRRAGETAAYPNGNGSLPKAELLSIALKPGWGGRGIGRRLARGIVSGLAERGVHEGKVVVGADNVGANRMYETVGFHRHGRINVHSGENSNVWVWRWSS